ncbi:hypothetical protein FW774_18060 [Pedobacter sp. BS3]|uniref:hypothetical protein n=1 Tax=Pedobacter sp. BS3 TaxID=2567937 RepID=UPI0011EC9846|nr:hypothetical protein [Pedobacter sp. BS3]TZF81466.1 hypothetical protein FW774_18060 [Pedobacter sp. BS3]
MLKKISFAGLLVLIISHFTYAQDNLWREYKISMIGTSQTIYLIEQKDNSYTGYITSDFFRPLKKILFITVRKVKNFQIREDLPRQVVKTTMQALKSQGIEALKKCEDDEQCSKINFLDPDHLAFEITVGSKRIKAGFQAVYPERKSNTPIESTTLRRQAQVLITIVDKSIDLENEFRKSRSKIKPPYCYGCGGISYCCVR